MNLHNILCKEGGKVLAEIRKAKGLSQRQLSAKSGVPFSTIQYWERRGIGRATVGNALKVARALGVTLDELAGR